MIDHRMGSRIKSVPAWNGLTRLVLLSICFGVGALGGFLFSSWSGDNPELLDYLRRYFQMASQENELEPPLWLSIWDLTRWPLMAFLLGSTALGVLGIPILLGVRSFLLAFSAMTFARMFGLPGAAASLAAFGITALAVVPILFVVSEDAFRQSLAQLSGERPMSWGQRIQTLTPCAGLLILAIALQQTLMPALFTTVCARLFNS